MRLNLTAFLTVYLMWRFPPQWAPNVGGAVVTYYTLGYLNWKVQYYATGPGPVNTINIPQGVTADGYVSTNSVIPVMAGVTANSAGWVYNPVYN